MKWILISLSFLWLVSLAVVVWCIVIWSQVNKKESVKTDNVKVIDIAGGKIRVQYDFAAINVMQIDTADFHVVVIKYLQ